jgi:trehalose 6-phosphate synthase
VDALNKALHMPLPDRTARWREMMDTVSRNNVAAWRDSFVETLAKVPLAAP